MVNHRSEELSAAPGLGSRIGSRFGSGLGRGVVALVAVAAFVGGTGSIASAAPGDTDTGTVDATVEVTTAIALTGLPASFTLTGIPGATVVGLGAVTMVVTTNNLAGYAVTVESSIPALLPTAVANADSIPIGALSVRETGATLYTPVSNAAANTVHTQATRSAADGDNLSNDFQVVIPFVNEDTYTASLNYIATTL